ncbi:MAG: hypothetical protein ACRDPY_45540 [Streptosporangiaceae bacterium]
MSRRRTPPPPNPAVIPFSAVVVCTDRGQHPRALITRLGDQRAGGAGIAYLVMRRQGELVSGHHAPDAPDTIRFACSRCSRDVRLRAPNVLAALDALREVQDGRLTLDISLC